MTYQEFLQKLRATPRDWSVTPHLGMIRRWDGPVCQCPVSSLSGLSAMDFDVSAKRLGLANSLRAQIVCAADNNSVGRPTNVRADLLRACGLSA